MSLNSFSTGVNTSFTSELNENFNGLKVQQVYTSTGFDVTRTSAGTSSTAYEMDAVASSSIGAANYVNISSMVTTILEGTASLVKSAKITIEIKEVGGSYGTIFDDFVSYITTSGEYRETLTVNYTHTLTAGEKSNGFQIRITGTITSVTVDTNSISNQCTVIKLLG